MDSTKVRRVKLDGFGRVLIPKKIRERLGLETGQELELSVEGHRVTLEVQKGATLVKKGNIPVFEGTLPKDDVDWVREMRQERDKVTLKGGGED